MESRHSSNLYLNCCVYLTSHPGQSPNAAEINAKRQKRDYIRVSRISTYFKPDLPCLNGRMSYQVIIFLAVVQIYQVPPLTSEACYPLLVGSITNDDQ